MPIIRKFPGTIGASSAPRITRRAMRVGKLLANPVAMRIHPHRSCTTNMSLAMGNRCRRLPLGRHQNKYPNLTFN